MLITHSSLRRKIETFIFGFSLLQYLRHFNDMCNVALYRLNLGVVAFGSHCIGNKRLGLHNADGNDITQTGFRLELVSLWTNKIIIGWVQSELSDWKSSRRPLIALRIESWEMNRSESKATPAGAYFSTILESRVKPEDRGPLQGHAVWRLQYDFVWEVATKLT